MARNPSVHKEMLKIINPEGPTHRKMGGAVEIWFKVGHNVMFIFLNNSFIPIFQTWIIDVYS